jgi:hypothetical protein
VNSTLDLRNNMKRLILFIFIYLFTNYGLAFSESLSIAIKPSSGLSGTISFNIHENGASTILKYESPTNIIEDTVKIRPELVSEINNLSHIVLQEYMGLNQFSQWPEQQETISVAITNDKVTKSISTRRFSKNILMLKKLIKEKIK